MYGRPAQGSGRRAWERHWPRADGSPRRLPIVRRRYTTSSDFPASSTTTGPRTSNSANPLCSGRAERACPGGWPPRHRFALHRSDPGWERASLGLECANPRIAVPATTAIQTIEVLMASPLGKIVPSRASARLTITLAEFLPLPSARPGENEKTEEIAKRREGEGTASRARAAVFSHTTPSVKRLGFLPRLPDARRGCGRRR